MRLVSFDLDGTLVNTRSLNREAYRRAGVEIPDEAWGLSWREWLPDVIGGDLSDAVAVHQCKQDYYLELIDAVPADDVALPPARLALEIQRTGQDDVVMLCLTAASLLAARALLNRLRLFVPVIANLRYDQRRDLLVNHVVNFETANGVGGRPVVYVDDSQETVRRLRDEVVGLASIWYDRQTYSDLLYEVGQHVGGVLGDARRGRAGGR